MANRLPKYYIVLADLKNPLWRKYIDYLNTLNSLIIEGYRADCWYGYDGSDFFNGVRINFNRDRFINNPTVLTLEEFFDLKNEVEVSAIRVTSTHKNTVKSVAIHIEVEGQENIDRLYLNICLVQSTLNKGYAGRVIELLEGIMSQLKA